MTEDKHVPCWRYNATQGAKLITTEDELAEAEAQGWRDSPGAALAVGAPLVGAQDTEPSPDDGVAEALEAAEDAIDKAQFEMAQAVKKKRKR